MRQSGNREGNDGVSQRQMYLNEANQVTEKSRDATRRMVALVEETKAVGIDTMDEVVSHRCNRFVKQRVIFPHSPVNR